MEGHIVRADEHGFAIKFSACTSRYNGLFRKILVHFNQSRLGKSDISCKKPDDDNDVEFENGKIVECKISDLAIGSATFEGPHIPRTVETVNVGDLTGKVVRHFDTGFVVSFDPPDFLNITADA